MVHSTSECAADPQAVSCVLAFVFVFTLGPTLLFVRCIHVYVTLPLCVRGWLQEYDPNEEWYYPSSPSNSRPASASPSNFQQGTTVDNPPDSEHPVESTLTASQLDIPTSELPSVFGDASSLPSEDAELYREPTPSSDSEDDQEKKPQPILGEQTVVRTAIAAQEAEIPVILRH